MLMHQLGYSAIGIYCSALRTLPVRNPALMSALRQCLSKMKQKTIFVCQECGAKSPKWVGQCPECNKWNTMVEELVSSIPSPSNRRRLVNDSYDQPKPISSIETIDQERLKSGIEEFDRVLGGGAVPGSVILIGGDPGIGKSTLLLQVLDRLTQNYGKTLYVSGEESARQIKL
ncbi:TPA: hypothetical protein ENX78_11335, partial [Candidatus Poribacteria bacterium]|nr:hypothetical protein [Candidatus Poribacteria bacterium]